MIENIYWNNIVHGFKLIIQSYSNVRFPLKNTNLYIAKLFLVEKFMATTYRIYSGIRNTIYLFQALFYKRFLSFTRIIMWSKSTDYVCSVSRIIIWNASMATNFKILLSFRLFSALIFSHFFFAIRALAASGLSFSPAKRPEIKMFSLIY